MRKMSWMSFAASAVMIMALMLTSCGDDNNGGTGPANTISAEDQFNQIDDLIDLDFDGDSESLLGIDATDFGVGSLNFAFMDGVDEGDFEDYLMEIPGLGKRIPGEIRASSVSFSYSDGWWTIHADSTLINTAGTISADITTHVRFEDASGTPQMQPGASTVKYTEKATLDVMIAFTMGQSSVDLDYSLQSEGTVVGLNSTSLTLNSTNDATVVSTFVDQDLSTVQMELSVEGHTTDVVFPGEGCPSSGSLDAVIGLDLSYVGTEGTFSAVGTWNLGLDIQSDGSANVTVSSGDFTRTATTDLCMDNSE